MLSIFYLLHFLWYSVSSIAITLYWLHAKTNVPVEKYYFYYIIIMIWIKNNEINTYTMEFVKPRSIVQVFAVTNF